MSGQSRDVVKLFEKRMQVIGKISKENAEHLRLLQLRSGQEVLKMNNTQAAEIHAAQQDCEAELAACQQRIEVLERSLEVIDIQIANAT